jgi:hypothetical protein
MRTERLDTVRRKPMSKESVALVKAMDDGFSNGAVPSAAGTA